MNQNEKIETEERLKNIAVTPQTHMLVKRIVNHPQLYGISIKDFIHTMAAQYWQDLESGPQVVEITMEQALETLAKNGYVAIKKVRVNQAIMLLQEAI